MKHNTVTYNFSCKESNGVENNYNITCKENKIIFDDGETFFLTEENTNSSEKWKPLIDKGYAGSIGAL